MKIKPAKNAKQPSYPTIDMYAEHPELLYKSIPERWVNNKYVAASFMTFILLGIPKSKIIASHPAIETVDRINSNSDENTKNEDIRDSFKVAPVFVHGKGAGSIGCVSISPPVFISEDEALTIILKALDKHGIKLDTVQCPEIKFEAPSIANSCYSSSEDDSIRLPDVKVELRMDGYSKASNLAVQYVSENDFFKFVYEDGCWSSLMEINTLKAAEIIREKLVANGETNAVVFYDPIVRSEFRINDPNYDWKKAREKAKKEAEKLLLKQVEDFIKWLGKEKITGK